MDSVIAIDLGGTKLTTAVVDRDGNVSWRKKLATDASSLEATVEQIVAVVHEAMAASSGLIADSSTLGIIVPGIYFCETGNVWAPNLWGHDQVPLRAELERRLALKIVVDSDRAGYVIGERWMGIARGLNDIVFLSVGTGIGAGILAGGQLIRGHSDIAGAVGWFALNPSRHEIYRQVGCWEAEAAGPGLARRYGVSSAKEVVSAAREGDASAIRAIEESAQYLGMGIANIVSILNPEMIVLGGGLMQAADLFLEPMRQVMAEWAQPISAKQVRIEVTRLGEDAGLLGAARLAFDQSPVE
jgi:glucokinase